jgi:hypothetical protein
MRLLSTDRRIAPIVARTGHAAPLGWQRTDTVGTEMVFWPDTGLAAADGTAVLVGRPAYTVQWHTEAAADLTVRALTVACRGAGWTRTLRLSRDRRDWTCRTEETGDLAASPPGIDDPARLDPDAVLRLPDSPIFVSWAVRRLRLTPEPGAVHVPTVRVLTPSLAVLPGVSTYHVVGPGRLRIGGDEPASVYDLDGDCLVTYQSGRCRLVR